MVWWMKRTRMIMNEWRKNRQKKRSLVLFWNHFVSFYLAIHLPACFSIILSPLMIVMALESPLVESHYFSLSLSCHIRYTFFIQDTTHPRHVIGRLTTDSTEMFRKRFPLPLSDITSLLPSLIHPVLHNLLALIVFFFHYPPNASTPCHKQGSQ